MLKKNCRRLPVVDSYNKITGIISATDIIGAAFMMNKSFLAVKLINMMYAGEAGVY